MKVLLSFLASLSVIVACGDDSQGFSSVQSLASAKEIADQRINKIRGTLNSTFPEDRVCYYISERTGNDGSDGRTPESAWKSISRLNLAEIGSGALVLFERGGCYRGTIEARSGVTYSSYGDGPKPCIWGSPKSGSNFDDWRPTGEPDIWAFAIGHNDVGTVVFDDGERHATKILLRIDRKTGDSYDLKTGRVFKSFRDVSGDLRFWHDYKESGILYLCSKQNPAERFGKIEFCTKCHGINVAGCHDVLIDNLAIAYVGAHGVAAQTCRNLMVRNCEFAWIGGSIQSENLFGRDYPTRFGNAVEIWGGCDGFVVSNCYIRQVYDAGITHQYCVDKSAGKRKYDASHVRFSNNVIEKCNYSIEYFLSAPNGNDSRLDDVVYENNIMLDAGYGFCEQRPDKGEAAHIKSWGCSHDNLAKDFVIRNNIIVSSRDMLVQIGTRDCSSASLPRVEGNTFLGAKEDSFGSISCESSERVNCCSGAKDLANMHGTGNRLVQTSLMIFKMLPGEKWWGFANYFGSQMPYDENTVLAIELCRFNYSNQCASFLVSNKGRYVWCDGQSDLFVGEGQISLRGDNCVYDFRENCGDLRATYLCAANVHFKASGRAPNELFFSAPQYNTWIELTYNQNERDVLSYAKSMLDNGMPPGVLMIDDTWQHAYGTWEFDGRRFVDPKGMVRKLHEMGFKVMLWMCPWVSMDSPEYRRIALGINPNDVRGWSSRGGFLIDGGNGLPASSVWWNGCSALLDFTHPNANAWFAEQLDRLASNYGIDGFKFDGGNIEYYTQGYLPRRREATSGDQVLAYAEYALRYPFCEFRCAWKLQGLPVVERLHDKEHSWKALRKLIPDLIAAGLLGHSFVCPDMVGGGEWRAFIPGSSFEPELFVRSAQVHALCGMMQFSASPWRCLDHMNQDIIRKTVKMRQEKFADRFVKLAKECAKTGEPMIRNLEYNYPNAGYEYVLDEFMMGDFVLVAPVLRKGATERTVILPPGRWVSDQKKVIDGPVVLTENVTLERLPYYEKID